MYNKVAIIGIGSLGGSLALAIKKNKLAEKVVGYDRILAHRKKALRNKIVDEIFNNLRLAVADADLILLCMPVRSIIYNLPFVVHYAKAGALVMDIGSTKEAIVKRAQELFKRKKCFFVGAHPMAGTEKAGPEAAHADLFVGKECILTPFKRSSRKAVAEAIRFWENIGGEVSIREASVHDSILAKTSHLPQMVAYSLMKTIEDTTNFNHIHKFSGGGLRDTTRIAASPAEVWVDITLSNKNNLVTALEKFLQETKSVLELIKSGDAQKLEKCFRKISLFRIHLARYL